MKNSTKLDVDLFENLKLELRRGCLIVAVLAQLRQEHYGYTLRKALDDLGLAIDEGTLYPLLRRLETPGAACQRMARREQAQQAFLPALLQGELILQQLLQEWQTINASLGRILQEA